MRLHKLVLWLGRIGFNGVVYSVNIKCRQSMNVHEHLQGLHCLLRFFRIWVCFVLLGSKAYLKLRFSRYCNNPGWCNNCSTSTTTGKAMSDSQKEELYAVAGLSKRILNMVGLP